ncbi:unnamed protein product, partial [Meganyctiphanes norvegica]
FQLVHCDAIPLLISRLSEHRQEPPLRTALLRALVGVEHCYSGRDLVLKNYLAAKILPELTEQFDEIMSEYRSIRRAHIDGQCIHSVISSKIKKETVSEEISNGKKENQQASLTQEKNCDFENSSIKSEVNLSKNSCLPDSDSSHIIKAEFISQEDSINNSKVSELEKLQKDKDSFKTEKHSDVNKNIQSIASTSKAAIKISFNDCGSGENSEDSVPETSGSSSSNSSPFVGSVTKKLLNLQQLSSGISFPHLSVKNFESKGKLNEISSPSSPEDSCSSHQKSPRSTSPPIGYNPKNPGSLSCSPRSYYSSSPSNSPSCSPPHVRSDSPTFSPPFFSASYVSPPHNLPPWNFDSSSSSSPSVSSKVSSPPYNMSSPPRSTSPIKVPSDWEYDDDDDDNMDEESRDMDGRFSPTVPDIEAIEGEEGEDDDAERFQTPEVNKEPIPGCSLETNLTSVFKPIKEEPASPNPYDDKYLENNVKEDSFNKVKEIKSDHSLFGSFIKKEIKLENDKDFPSCSNFVKEIKQEIEDIKPKIENIKNEQCIKEELYNKSENPSNSLKEMANDNIKKETGGTKQEVNHSNISEDCNFLSVKRPRSPEENQETIGTKKVENKRQRYESRSFEKSFSDNIKDEKNIKSEFLESSATFKNSPAEGKDYCSDNASSSGPSSSEVSNQENKQVETPKSPFVEFNKIKFRVGKRGVAKRQQYHK